MDTVVWGLDLKRTRDVSQLAAADAVREFVSIGSLLARNTGRVDPVVETARRWLRRLDGRKPA